MDFTKLYAKIAMKAIQNESNNHENDCTQHLLFEIYITEPVARVKRNLKKTPILDREPYVQKNIIGDVTYLYKPKNACKTRKDIDG